MRLFNIEIDNMTIAEAASAISDMVQQKKKGYIVTPNVDHIVKLNKDQRFAEAYNKASYCFADGMPVVWMAKLAGKPLKAKVSGSDLFIEMLEQANQKAHSIFLLGASEETNKKSAQIIEEKYKSLRLAGRFSPEPGFESDSIRTADVIERINMVQPDLLFLFLGTPKQEYFIHKHIDSMNISCAMGLGASLDFFTGTHKRAPLWMQKSGLEWVWRMFSDPGRLIKRYLIDDLVPFSILSIKELWKSRVLRR